MPFSSPCDLILQKHLNFSSAACVLLPGWRQHKSSDVQDIEEPSTFSISSLQLYWQNFFCFIACTCDLWSSIFPTIGYLEPWCCLQRGTACISGNPFKICMVGFSLLITEGENKPQPQFTTVCPRSLDQIVHWKVVIGRAHVSAQLHFNLFCHLPALSRFLFLLQQNSVQCCRQRRHPSYLSWWN